MSPLSGTEVQRIGPALARAGIRPQWLDARDRQGVFLLELRAELLRGDESEQALAERVARTVWTSIGRFVRIVLVFPQLDDWPGGIEFGERDYRRLLRR